MDFSVIDPSPRSHAHLTRTCDFAVVGTRFFRILAVILAFGLLPAADVCIAVASDFHVTTDGHGVEKISAAAQRRGATSLLALGDLVDDAGKNSSLQLWTDAVNRSSIPVVCVPGNHDFAYAIADDGSLQSTPGAIAQYQDLVIPRELQLGPLSAQVCCITWPGWSGHREHLDWLIKQIAKPPESTLPLLILNHFPIDAESSPVVLGTRRPLLWLSGHLHSWLNKGVGSSWNFGSPAWRDGFWLLHVNEQRVRAEKCTAEGNTFEAYEVVFDPQRATWISTAVAVPAQPSADVPRVSSSNMVDSQQSLQVNASTARAGIDLSHVSTAHLRLVNAPTKGVIRGILPHVRYLPAPFAGGRDASGSDPSGSDHFTCLDDSSHTLVTVTIDLASPMLPDLKALWSWDDFVTSPGSPLSGHNGGSGWAGAWQAKTGSLKPFVYQIIPGQKMRSGLVNGDGSRPLIRPLGPGRKDIWIALAMREIEAQATASVQLLSTGAAVLTLHLDADGKTWQLDQAGVPLPEPSDQKGDGSDSDTWVTRNQNPKLRLMRLRFANDLCEVGLWDDPDLYQPPGFGASLFTVPSFSADTISVRANGVALDAVVIGDQALAVTLQALVPEALAPEASR